METTYLTRPSPNAIAHEKKWNRFFEVPHGCDYPDHYEFTVNLPEVGAVKVRPIRSGDATLFKSFFKELTPRSVYLRFFTFLKELPTKMFERFVYVDYDQEIALVALLEEDGVEKIVGDARVISIMPEGSAEFSILVTDRWQGQGIGACLLRHCFAIARLRRLKHIHGTVLAENRQMLALGRKLNFTIKHLAGTTEYELSKALD